MGDNEIKWAYMVRNSEYSYAEACKRTLFWRESTKTWAGRKKGDIYCTKEEAEAVLAAVKQLPQGKSGQCEERELSIVKVPSVWAEIRGEYYVEGRHHPCAKQKVRDRRRTIAKQKAWEDELTTYRPRFDPIDGTYIGD